MTDTNRLREWLDEKGLKIKAVAKKIGITPYSLSQKINNQSEFKISEICVFKKDYGMTAEDFDKIFFAAM